MPKTKIFFIDPLHLLLVYMCLHVFTCIRQSTCVFMLKNTFNNLSTNGTIISQEDTSLQTAPTTESAKNIHHSKRLQPKRWTVSSALGCLCGDSCDSPAPPGCAHAGLLHSSPAKSLRRLSRDCRLM